MATFRKSTSEIVPVRSANHENERRRHLKPSKLLDLRRKRARQAPNLSWCRALDLAQKF